MKHREKPKYSVRQNVCFMVRTAWEKRRRVLLLCVVVAAIKVALDLAQLYVTPEILTRVEQGVPVGELLTTIGFFTVALLLLQGAAAYCDAIRMPGEIDVRCAIIRMISRKSGETSYLNIPEPFRFEGGVQPPAADGYELRLENVSFRYPGTERDIPLLPADAGKGLAAYSAVRQSVATTAFSRQ